MLLPQVEAYLAKSELKMGSWTRLVHSHSPLNALNVAALVSGRLVLELRLMALRLDVLSVLVVEDVSQLRSLSKSLKSAFKVLKALPALILSLLSAR